MSVSKAQSKESTYLQLVAPICWHIKQQLRSRTGGDGCGFLEPYCDLFEGKQIFWVGNIYIYTYTCAHFVESHLWFLTKERILSLNLLCNNEPVGKPPMVSVKNGKVHIDPWFISQCLLCGLGDLSLSVVKQTIITWRLWLIMCADTLGEIVIEFDELKTPFVNEGNRTYANMVILSIVSGIHYLFLTTYSILTKVFEIWS